MSSDETSSAMKVPEVPPALRKKGITTCTYNLKPGEYVDISGAFFNVFRKELEEKFIVTKKKI